MSLFSRFAALGALLTSAVLAAATPEDVERTADAAALSVDGLIAPCPASVRQASASARCVTSDLNLVATRKALSASKLHLYGAWRTDGQGRVYNWVTLPNGYVNIGIVPGSTNAEASLILLTPSAQKPAPQTSAAPSSTPQVPTSSPQAPAPVRAEAPASVPAFKRPLRLTSPRMNGADVRLLQLRLMEVSRVDPGQGGDGWFGPVTEANVIVFQLANGLKSTGVVDLTTWNALFSTNAKYFDAQAAQELAKRRR